MGRMHHFHRQQTATMRAFFLANFSHHSWYIYAMFYCGASIEA